MSEFSPLLAETSDMELAPTKSRTKGWRRKRRRSRHFCPQCGQLTGGSAQSVVASIRKIFCTIGVCRPRKADEYRLFDGVLARKKAFYE